MKSHAYHFPGSILLKAPKDALAVRWAPDPEECSGRRLRVAPRFRRKVRGGRCRSGALTMLHADGRKFPRHRVGWSRPRNDDHLLGLRVGAAVQYPESLAWSDKTVARESAYMRLASSDRSPIPSSVPRRAIAARVRCGHALDQTTRSRRWRREARSLVLGLFHEFSDELYGDDLTIIRNLLETIDDHRRIARVRRGESGPCQFGNHLACCALCFGRNFLRRLQHVAVDIQGRSHGEMLMHLMPKSRIDAKEGAR